MKKVSSSGISTARLSSKATSIKQIDNFLEKAKKEYSLLANYSREDSGKSQSSCLFWSTALVFLTLAIIFFIPSFFYNYYFVLLYFLIFTLIFFIVKISIPFIVWFSQRNHYLTIMSVLNGASTILQEQIEDIKSKKNTRISQQEQQIATERMKLREELIADFAQLNRDVTIFAQKAKLLGADWQDTLWQFTTSSQQLTIPSASHNILRCGNMTISHEQQYTASFPFFIPFPAGQSILFQASRDAYEQAATFLQSLLLRLVTTQSPGMVHFTFFDPLNFGQYVAPFMQLSAYDPALAGSRVWTENSHIEQQLVALSEYLAQVNQQYFWGATPTIEEYNRQNPRHQLPYRILVVQGFPFKFSPEAVRTLLTIARNGSRCGVYAIILCDMEQLALSGITLDNLNQIALTLRWEGRQVYLDGIQSELQAHNVLA